MQYGYINNSLLHSSGIAGRLCLCLALVYTMNVLFDSCVRATTFLITLAYTEHLLYQCFSTAGPWHQLYRAARGSPGICHFSFLSNFH